MALLVSASALHHQPSADIFAAAASTLAATASKSASL